jgi:hypothetical protein
MTTLFRTPISGVVPLTNIYENAPPSDEENTPTSWVDTIFPKSDDEDTYDEHEGYIQEGMKSKKNNSLQRGWSNFLKKIQFGFEKFSKATYYLPDRIDKNATRDATLFTEAIYDITNHKPKQATKKEVKVTESAIRANVNITDVITQLNSVFKKINGRLRHTANEEAFQTKELIRDDMKSLIYKMQNMDVANVNGETVYENLMLNITSIQRKLSELRAKTETQDIQVEYAKIIKSVIDLQAEKYLLFEEDKTCKNKKRVYISQTFGEDSENVQKRISEFMQKNSKIIAEPFSKDYRDFTEKLTQLYYSNPVNFSKKLANLKNNYKLLKNNPKYYVFDTEINKLKSIAEQFRFEQKAATETVIIPPDNSKLEADKKHDAGVMVRVMYMFISVPLIIFATYNWYYMMVYRDEERFPSTDGGGASRACNKDNRVLWDFSYAGVLDPVIDYFLGFCIFFTRRMDTYLLDDAYIPRFFSNDFALRSRAWIMVMFMVIIYYILCKMSFKELMRGNASGPLVQLAFAMVMIYYAYMMVFILFGADHTADYIKRVMGGDILGLMTGGFKQSPLHISLHVLCTTTIGIFIAILLFIILFFIALLSINTSIMVFILYIFIYSIFGFYIYRSTVDETKRDFFSDILHGFASYKSTWADLDKVFEKEVDEWRAMENCGTGNIQSWLSIHVLGNLFSWFWVLITLIAVIYSSTKLRLMEMKLFLSLFIVLIGGICTYTALFLWKDYGEYIQNPAMGGILGWLLARKWGGIAGVVFSTIMTLILKKKTQGETPETSETAAT